jgi:hypothetical protein
MESQLAQISDKMIDMMWYNIDTAADGIHLAPWDADLATEFLIICNEHSEHRVARKRKRQTAENIYMFCEELRQIILMNDDIVRVPAARSAVAARSSAADVQRIYFAAVFRLAEDILTRDKMIAAAHSYLVFALDWPALLDYIPAHLLKFAAKYYTCNRFRSLFEFGAEHKSYVEIINYDAIHDKTPTYFIALQHHQMELVLQPMRQIYITSRNLIPNTKSYDDASNSLPPCAVVEHMIANAEVRFAAKYFVEYVIACELYVKIDFLRHLRDRSANYIAEVIEQICDWMFKLRENHRRQFVSSSVSGELRHCHYYITITELLSALFNTPAVTIVLKTPESRLETAMRRVISNMLEIKLVGYGADCDMDAFYSLYQYWIRITSYRVRSLFANVQ